MLTDYTLKQEGQGLRIEACKFSVLDEDEFPPFPVTAQDFKEDEDPQET